MLSPNVHISKHPLVGVKLSILRDRGTDSMLFRAVMDEMALMLGYEATDDISISADNKYNESIALVPILRAGLGLEASFLRLLPTSRVFHLGLFRERASLLPVEYYNKLGGVAADKQVAILLDPMIATGGTMVAAVSAVKDWMDSSKEEHGKRIKIVTVCVSKTGIEAIVKAHPDVHIYTAAVDNELSADGYIVPGLGDAGDRLYRTK